jgi:hypothetical protein
MSYLKDAKAGGSCSWLHSSRSGFLPYPSATLGSVEERLEYCYCFIGRGMLSRVEVQKHLERLLPGKWVWEIKAHEENTFLAKLPSKVE